MSIFDRLFADHKGYSEDQIQDIINATPDFGQQIDAIAEARNWFRPCTPGWSTVPVLNAYLSDALTAEKAVDELATAIEQAWAENLRNPPTKLDDSTDAASGLLDLWFAVILAAKKVHPNDEDDKTHQKLLDLLLAFQSRPDPRTTQELPPRPGDDLVTDFSQGDLWRNLTLISLATAESRNDCPSHYPDRSYTGPEIQAWLNIHAFWAKLTVAGVRDMFDIAMCHMALSTEGGGFFLDAVDQDGVCIDFRVTLVWLTIAGKEWWDKCCEGPYFVDVPLDVNVNSKRCPWAPKPPMYTRILSKARWRWCKGRFGLKAASKGEKFSEGSKQLARKIHILMGEIEDSKVE